MTAVLRVVWLIVAALAVPAAVFAAPVNPPQPVRWEPQLVSASHSEPAAAGDLGQARQALVPGVGDERGLQVQTILAKRAISAEFPEIRDIGGVRPDSMKWHPQGLAIDVIIPEWDTAAGRALGDRIAKFTMANAKRFGLEYLIWQQTYVPAKGKPHRMDDLGSPDANHYTHVHISTYGGGFPKGAEVYLAN